MRLPGLDKVWDQGFTGKGQTIAVIDSGFFAHADFAYRVVGYVDMSGKSKRMLDRWGHGTHVAGIAAGSGGRSQGRMGNKFRLIVKIEYGWGQIYICWFGTHAEYDKIDAATVERDD